MSFAAANQGLINQMSSIAAVNTGCVLREGKHLPRSGVSVGAVICSRHGDHQKLLFRGRYSLRRRSPLFLSCSASGSQRKNPDFSRQSKGFSRGRSRQSNQDGKDGADIPDEGAADLLASKNGPLLSLSGNNPRHQATAAPGQREKEIVELFRKVQAQLRERAAAKEEKKAETTAQAQGGERGTVDSLLKLLRKHSADQGKKPDGLEEADRSSSGSGSGSPFEDAAAQSSSFFESSSMGPEEDVEEVALSPPAARRPPSNFQRRSPVPRVKYQPVYSAEEVDGAASSAAQKPAAKKTKKKVDEEDEDEAAEPISLDEREALDDEPSSDDSDAEEEDAAALPAAESSELSSLKLSELRALAKSRGMKGYSKLKKSELVELLAR